MKKKIVRGRYVTMKHSKYDLYRGAAVVGWAAIAAGIVLGAYLWHFADESEKKAKHHLTGGISKPTISSHMAQVVRPVKNLTFG